MNEFAGAEAATADTPVGIEPPLFPMARRCPLDPPLDYARLRAEEPVSKVKLRATGREAWLLTRYEDVRALLSHPAVSSNIKHPAYPLQMPIPEEILAQMELPMVSMDPPDLTVRRKLLLPEFTFKQMQALRPLIQKLADEHVDAMLEEGKNGQVDLVQLLALPVPSKVFCELLGVPSEDAQLFQDYAVMTLNRDATPEERGANEYRMQAYLHQLVAAKEAAPGADLISRLIARNQEGPMLPQKDLISMISVLLVGGFDTTANMISLGIATLLRHPEQLEQIRRDPTLVPNAVEELLRYLSISDSATVRVAMEDIQIGDVLVRAGEGVIAANGAANRDDSVFAEPDQFDVQRDTSEHIAFGHSVHQCLGQTLARIELEIVFTTLLQRIPGIRLAVPLEELPFKNDVIIYGLYSLPVTW
ncbi:cytochrome P450 [Kitasatospora sp. NPDC086801]|uniref:cytochrome P450 n=1 Tax=Kitasatospora sp. NPDC086801 TaxID=3364066 RepID=UPI0037F93C77